MATNSPKSTDPADAALSAVEEALKLDFGTEEGGKLSDAEMTPSVKSAGDSIAAPAIEASKPAHDSAAWS